MTRDSFNFSVEQESSVEDEVAVWAEANGWLARKTVYVGRRGCADHHFYGHGVVVLMEFKRASDGRLSENQVQEHRRLKKVGITVAVVDTAAEGIAYLKRFMC